MKACNRCGAVGDLFTKNAASPDGYYSICRECRKKTHAAWASRPEVVAREKARLAAAYEARKEELAVKRRQRYAAKKEATLAKNREWRERNLERHRELCRAWAKNNPIAMRAIVAKRRSAEREAEGFYTARDVSDMLLRQDGNCACCSARLEAFHVDHVIPLSRGGSNWTQNLQLLCPPCNLSKGAKLPDEFSMHRAKTCRS